MDDSWEEICPRELPVTILPATDFGDDWNDKLDAEDRELASRYFKAIGHLATQLDYVNLRRWRNGSHHQDQRPEI